jgi:1-deoxy-D-xylulose-5-phosphate reductoisomerase
MQDYSTIHTSILGSTGSIGKQALAVVQAHPHLLKVEALAAHRNVDLLVEQALAFRPRLVAIADEKYYLPLKQALAHTDIRVVAGQEGLSESVTLPIINIVLTALVGFAGLEPTLSALNAGKDIALANKETLVVAGETVMSLAQENGRKIIPVDSEHSAIYQCLVGENSLEVEKLWLTASGGPFRGFSAEQLEHVSLEQALNHPNWTMGSKITIDSATMMNKGLEVIEARWLFDLQANKIGIVVHPQSIIHSLVQFNDGSQKAQLGLPDMRLPIQYALCYGQRPKNAFPRFNFFESSPLTFESVDTEVFRSIDFAYEALHQGGNMPCILNAANEVAVARFLERQINFTAIYNAIERGMTGVPFIKNPSLDDLKESDAETRRIVSSFAEN